MIKHEPRKCDVCGEMFTPKRSTQHSCCKPLNLICPVCGESYTTICSKDKRKTCSNPECRKHAASICEPTERSCKGCGEKFTTIRLGQVYCNREKTKACPVCGKVFSYVCNSSVRATCSVTCQAALITSKRRAGLAGEIRICKWCGKEFQPREVRDVYCDGPHYKKCVICGKEFEIDVRKDQEVETCSKECMGKLMSQNHDYVKGAETHRQVLLERYGVENSAKVPGAIEKQKATMLAKYGKEWYTQTDEYKEKAKATNLQKYGVEHHLQASEIIEKRKQTCIDKYGAANVLASEFGKQRIKETLLDKYGAEYIMQVPEIKRKATAHSRNSMLEMRICNLLDNYGIQYTHHYVLNKEANGKRISHEFDFYLPDYKLLIDADGLYFHSYLDDPDGVRVRDDYDEVRLFLVPEDHRFQVLVEGSEDKQLKELVELIESSGADLSTYDSAVFNWCRSIEFPYPEYSDKRLFSDWLHLSQYENDEYIPQCRIGQSLIKQFHKSLYKCHVRNCMSPYEAWYDDNKLKHVIRNRFIYKNTVEPAKVLSGFNLSRICPTVSTFNPILARYLVKRYLADYNEIVDPFSGFSGRLLGVASTGKSYTGQDLNDIAVSESQEIIKFLQLDTSRYSVSQTDILQSHGQYECLLTCPPYSNKEIYNSETVFKSCDEWIHECLSRFSCKTYVFVVDETSEFAEYVTETITSKSHLSTAQEHVVVINS